MTFYLSAAFGRQNELRGYRKRLRAVGHDVASAWLDEVETDETAEDAYRARCAEQDARDIERADVFVAFTDGGPARGGRHVELGIAIAQARDYGLIDIIVVGPHEHAFHAHPTVTETYSDPEAFLAAFGAATEERP
jgi:hypothetical protein